MRGKRSNSAVFTPVSDEATFTSVSDEATFEQIDPQEGFTKTDLDELFQDTDEDRFLRGEVKYVQSSNVEFFQYLYFSGEGTLLQQLVVGFLDGSSYIYEGVSLSEALLFFRTSSPGGQVWTTLRVRGTVFGYSKPYRKLSGSRVWESTNASIARHEAVPPSGESVRGWHPHLNWKGGAGKTGSANANLNKRAGSKKLAYFAPKQAYVR